MDERKKSEQSPSDSFFAYTSQDHFSIKKITNTFFQVEFLSASPLFPEDPFVAARYYPSRNARSAVILLHGLFSQSSVRFFSRYFAKTGISCFQPEMPWLASRIPDNRKKNAKKSNVDFAELFSQGFKQAVVETCQGIDFLSKEYEQIGILGVSMGGIIASVAASIDERIKASILLLAGGNIATLTYNLRGPGLKTGGERLRKTLSLQELAQQWKRIEPTSFKKALPNCLMINARFDKMIPPAHTKALRKSLGNPEIRWIMAGHLSTWLYAPWIRTIAQKHFFRNL
jgi:dienelactone hydrolase